MVLLVAAALVAQSFLNLRGIDLGYTPARVLAMNVAPSNPKPSTNAWVAQLLTDLSGCRASRRSARVFLRPLALGAIGQETWVTLEGQPNTAAASQRIPRSTTRWPRPGTSPR